MKISSPQMKCIYFNIKHKKILTKTFFFPFLFFTLGAVVDFQHQALITES